MQISVLHNRKEKLDPKMQTIENEIAENLTVTCRENFNEYLYNSSLHGLRYVGDRTISRLERVFFACMFFLVVIFSIYFISSIWVKWSASPLIITLSSMPISIKELPFPGKMNTHMTRNSLILFLFSEFYMEKQSPFAIWTKCVKAQFKTSQQTAQSVRLLKVYVLVVEFLLTMKRSQIRPHGHFIGKFFWM